ncbi:hypothetical protein COLO4_19492 [Corchorus olitorius]|uniref:Uncharacterized protein n=1 Tax=Corchorus olitorius TaxID=93759 RepID=A0A1R3J565_9ROSI|nr:hypothetical protein COLO4_19492 [Corchorus olitorius]
MEHSTAHLTYQMGKWLVALPGSLAPPCPLSYFLADDKELSEPALIAYVLA